jgi:hypothetical protein
MTFLYAYLLVLMLAVVFLNVRGIGWRWGVVTVVGWAVACCFAVAVGPVGVNTAAGKVCATVAGLYVVGIVALGMGRERLFKWIVGVYGMPATVFVLGGPG